MRLRKKKLFLLLLLISLLPACRSVTENISEARNQILKVAHEKHFVRESIQMPFFKLVTFSNITSQDSPLIIYLEGDGHSRHSRYELSKDPTPHQPLGLELALSDPRPNVVYIARPGQYPVAGDIRCDSKYWSTHRFSKEVIESTNKVIDYFKAQINHQNTRVQLIGFSGGGGLAILVAAQRLDVSSIITLAGDLDIVAMTAYHNTAPLTGSLNPIDFAPHLSHIPQCHFVGKKDKIVPLKIAQGYLKASRSESQAVQIQLIDATHQKGWSTKWPELLALQ